MDSCELSIVMPCLNEEKTLPSCIAKAKSFLEQHHVHGEIIIADNGSTDRSRIIAEEAGARVLSAEERGYGSAIRAGMAAAQGTYIIIGDADDSYDFSALLLFLEKLREGYDVVIGNRFQGQKIAGAMPFLHRYLGNPVLSFIGNLFFPSPVHDFHCGLRALRKDIVARLDLRTTGMEFASEMIVKAIMQRLRMCEVPVTLYPDGRTRPPHLRTWRDGWRHLRFLLLYSPRWLFFYPGIAFMLMGGAGVAVLLPGQQFVFDVHTLLYSVVLIIVGLNVLSFGLFAKVFAMQEGLLPRTKLFRNVYGRFTLEMGVLFGLLLFGMGIGLTAVALYLWSQNNFGNLDPQKMLRFVIPAVALLFTGIHVLFSSFLLSIIHIPHRDSSDVRHTGAPQ